MSPTPHAPPKQLILCADDFAVHASASRGIAQLARQGRLSATSVMVLSKRWALDVALLRDLRTRLDVGLHLDWTSDFARAAGHGLALPAAMGRSLLGGFEPRQARTVIERQLDAFEAHWQAPPDYVDGHQHVQQFAGIREALVQVLSARYPLSGAGGRPYLRISRAPRAARDLKSRIIAAMGATRLQTLARQAAVPVVSQLLGAYDFSGDRARYAGLMARWLELAPAGDCILMCHPALAAEPGDPIGAARAREGDYLGSADFAAVLAQHGVRLVRGPGTPPPG